MPKIIKPLTKAEVARLKEPGLHMVGEARGLGLLIKPTGARSWVLRVTIGGKRRDLGLGAYDEHEGLTLEAARAEAVRLRKVIKDGGNPLEDRRQARVQAAEKRQQEASRDYTFRRAAESYIAAHSEGWKNAKHAAQWSSTLATYAYPIIGDMRVEGVETPHVLDVLKPIWQKRETARRVRNRIELVLDAAKAEGRIKGPWENPARWRGHLDHLLAQGGKAAKVKPHPALPYQDTPAFLQRLESVSGMGGKALTFIIFTACRSGEARGMTWDEVDLAEAVWTVPEDRTKTGVTHRVPLSQAAIELLTSLPKFAGCPYVFPAPSGGMLSDMTISAVCKRLKVPAVPHGFRSTFRDWAAERTRYPHEVCEAALGHAVDEKMVKSYRRTDFFDLRRQLMDEWAGFLAQAAPAEADNITPIGERRAAG